MFKRSRACDLVFASAGAPALLDAAAESDLLYHLSILTYPLQVLDHQQEMVSAAGIQSLGGGGGSLGRGKMDRVLRITPGKCRKKRRKKKE